MRNEIQTYAAEKRLDASLLQRLEQLDVDAEECLLEVLTLGPSANTLRDILRLSEEICARDGVGFSELYHRSDIQTIFLREDSSRKEKQKLLRGALEVLRYPEVQKIREQLEQCRLTIRRECGLSVEYPQDFEGDGVSIMLSVRSSEDLRELAKKLEQAADHNAMRELFDVLNGEF